MAGSSLRPRLRAREGGERRPATSTPRRSTRWQGPTLRRHSRPWLRCGPALRTSCRWVSG